MTPEDSPRRTPEPPERPAFSPGPWARGFLYSLFALGAIAYGHFTRQRPLTLTKAVALCAFAILIGVVIGLLQTWARNSAEE